MDDNLFDIERAAMCGDYDAILKLVSGLRSYRAAIDRLAANRHRDGEVDSADMHAFLSEIAGINDLHFGME